MEPHFSKQNFKANYGKICRGSVVDAYNRLSQPSIPSKSEKLLEPLQKKEGFGSSSCRFSESLKKNPGPGQYSQKDLANPSVSKKGFGGLINIAPRFKRSQYCNLVPGPGTYYKKAAEVGKGFVIVPPKTVSLKKNENSPAPGQYDPLVQSGVSAVTSVFKSKSEKLKQEDKNYPAPWQYNPNYTLTRASSSVLTSAFKMPIGAKDKNSKLEFMVEEKKGSPGPGTYDKSKNIDKIPVSGSVFRSETERVLVTSKNKIPGPAFYKPVMQPKKRSFHYKFNNIWI